jgi:hypothetical protein
VIRLSTIRPFSALRIPATSRSAATPLVRYLLGANGYLIKPSKTDDLFVIAKGIRDCWLILNRNTGALENP